MNYNLSEIRIYIFGKLGSYDFKVSSLDKH